MSSVNLQEILEFAVDLAKQAGKLIVEGSEKRGKSGAGYDLKKNTADIVTETDVATEEFVQKKIAEKYPDHDFIGEESWAAGKEIKITEGPAWCIDPIDGTTNFSKAHFYCCISIGFVYQKRVSVGIVYSPFMGYLYTGIKGGGSFVSTPLQPEPRKLPLFDPLPLSNLRAAVIAVEWGADRRKEVVRQKTESFGRLVGDPENGVEGGCFAQGIRSLGSAALNGCSVASGTLDLYHEAGCWAWDVCAGSLINQEAGGLVLGSKDSTLSTLDDPSFGVVTPEILQGRKYLFIRPIGDTPEESGSAAQKRIAKEFFGALEEWEVV